MKSLRNKIFFLSIIAIAGILLLMGIYTQISGDPAGSAIIVAGCLIGLSGIILLLIFQQMTNGKR